jgi:NAD(P)-dependent dehydrogenase (short-subunit alcohol dehydrogenase family)
MFVGVMAGPLEYTEDGFEKQIATNHLSGFLLFHILKPALSKAAQSSGSPSRVVVLSSSAHAWGPVHFRDLSWTKFPMTYNQWQAYASSKTANVYTASAIDRKFSAQGIRAWSVHPGGIQTELARNLKAEDFEGFGDVGAIFSTYKSVEQGAATTVWAAVDPKVIDLGGRYLADCGETQPRAEGGGVNAGGYAEYVYDEEAEERLWKMSAALVEV